MSHVGMLEGLSVRRALELNIKSHLRQHAHHLKVTLSFFTALLCCLSKLVISSVQRLKMLTCSGSLTIYFVGAVHDSVGCMCVSDEVHPILLTVQRSLWSVRRKQK